MSATDTSAWLDPTITEGIIALDDTLRISKMVDTSYQAPMNASKGESVTIPVIPQVTEVGQHQAGVEQSDTGYVKATIDTITLDEHLYSKFTISDRDYANVRAGGVSQHLNEHIKNLARAVDNRILSKALGAANELGDKTAPIFGSDANSFVDAQTDLRTKRVMAQNCIVSNAMHGDLQKLNLIHQVNTSGSSEALRDGAVSRLYGWDLYTDEALAAMPLGPVGTPLVNGAVSIGDAVINMDGMTPGLVIPAGRDFTIGVTSYKTSDRSVVSAAGEVAVPVQPVLVSKADNAAVTFDLLASTAFLAFAPEALVLVNRPLSPIETGGHMIRDITNPATGVNFRLEMWRSNSETKVEISTLFGVKLLYPERIVVGRSSR